MDDLISRQDAIEAIASRDETNGTVKVFTGRQVNEILESLPTAEPKTGEWEHDVDGHFFCTNCKKYPEYQVRMSDYCPNCGAKMVREDGEEE